DIRAAEEDVRNADGRPGRQVDVVDPAVAGADNSQVVSVADADLRLVDRLGKAHGRVAGEGDTVNGQAERMRRQIQAKTDVLKVGANQTRGERVQHRRGTTGPVHRLHLHGTG